MLVLMELIATTAVPSLVRVTGNVAELPSVILPKFCIQGPRLTTVPVPLTAVVCGLPGSVSVKVILPALCPVAIGENVTQMLHAAVQLPSVLWGGRSVPAEQ